jgi:hypothetical protein
VVFWSYFAPSAFAVLPLNRERPAIHERKTERERLK